MPTLTSAPYNLPFDSLVVARVQARNFFGFGLKSTPNSEGVRIRRIPSKMGPIQVLLKTDTEITLSWSILTGTQTGNAVITSYNLYWDNNSGVSNILLASGIITQFKV